jgi:predicted transcriptional regulator
MTREQAATAITHLVNIYGEPPQMCQTEEAHSMRKGKEFIEYQLSVMFRDEFIPNLNEQFQLITGKGESWEAALLDIIRAFNDEVPQIAEEAA